MGRRVSKADMRQTELQRMILDMSGKYSAYKIFTDWIELTSLAIANSLKAIHDKVWERRECQYKAIMNEYNEEEQKKFPEMTAYLIEELEDNPRDVLGEVFMRSGMGSDAGGQFFTPYSISMMLADLSVNSEEEVISLSEPSCGSGGSIIAAAMKLKSDGVDYQKRLKVVAQDLDWRCVYMCYTQLSLLGINAICLALALAGQAMVALILVNAYAQYGEF